MELRWGAAAAVITGGVEAANPLGDNIFDIAAVMHLESIHRVYHQKAPRVEKAYEPRMIDPFQSGLWSLNQGGGEYTGLASNYTIMPRN